MKTGFTEIDCLFRNETKRNPLFTEFFVLRIDVASKSVSFEAYSYMMLYNFIPVYIFTIRIHHNEIKLTIITDSIIKLWHM